MHTVCLCNLDSYDQDVKNIFYRWEWYHVTSLLNQMFILIESLKFIYAQALHSIISKDENVDAMVYGHQR